MSRPPTTIQIKRKATDDPVDVLRVHELNGKRQRRTTEFVFTRQSVDATSSSHPEGTRRIKPLPRSGGQASLDATAEMGAAVTAPSNKHGDGQHGEGQQVNRLTSQLVDTEIAALEFAQHRRFHISRNSNLRGQQSPVIGSKIHKRSPTVFIERRPQALTPREEKQSAQAEPRIPAISLDTTEKADVSRLQKKPGLAARTSTKPTSPAPAQLAPVPSRNVRLPSGLVTPWDVTSEQLVQELQAYTLEEIGRNMAASEESKPAPAKPHPTPLSVKKAASSKFKPKVPALRYHERHPEEAAAAAKEVADKIAAAKEASARKGDEAEVDGDFVIDTYYRMPAEEVQMDGSKDYGYIVLESQPDIDEFYEDSSDHSDNEDYDDEDENAENHYSADYPDEEVSSDDEYDRNAYRFRTGNASDEEEFDEDDYDEDAVRDYPTRFPWLRSNDPPFMREDELRDEDEQAEDGGEDGGVGNVEDEDENVNEDESMEGLDEHDTVKHANEAVTVDAKPDPVAAMDGGLARSLPLR